MTPENRRIILATALSALVVFAFMWVQTKFAPQAPPAQQAAAPAPAAPAAPAQPPASAPAPAEPGAPGAVAPVAQAPEELVTLETAEYRATFTSHGGALASLELKGRKFRRGSGKDDVAVDLVRVEPGQARPLSVVASKELGGTGTMAGDPAARASMRVVAKDARSVTFEGQVGEAEVRKKFTVGDKPFQLGMELSARAPRKGSLVVLYPGFLPPDAPTPGFFSGGEIFETVTPLCRAGGKTARHDSKDKEETRPGTAAWIGLDQHYFLAALLPSQEVGECLFFNGPVAGERGAALRLPVDGALDVSFQLFQGPKQLDLLRELGRGLDTAVDYGAVTNLFAFFARILLYVMRVLHGFVQNWGLAIILLTFLVKLVLYPLTAKSMQSMNEMRKLQPEIEKLKAKFGDDKEKLNQAVMQMYQQHKVNPLGGCLPMLLQMPIWFALYATLQTSVELYREPFLWLADLTRYDPYYILPLLMGGSSFLMQKLSPQPADNAQAKMLLYFMPIFFTFIMLKLPAGLTLYILVNNVLSIAQQQWLMRRHPAPVPAAK